MKKESPQPGQESVWDYPRPPKMLPSKDNVRVEFGGTCIAESNRTFRVLETSHPPVYYIPQEDISMKLLSQTPNRRTFCEWKGMAVYWDIKSDTNAATSVAWSYPAPSPAFAELANYIAFYPGQMDACFVNDERVISQNGDFYGGWITSKIVGPFKGGDGTWGW